MSPEQKCAALRQLAKKRRRDSVEGYCRVSDFHGGFYECCFVSPWTKSAHNVDADVMLLGQPVGWVEPLRNPSHVAIASMGFASTFSRLSFGGRGRSTHPTSSEV